MNVNMIFLIAICEAIKMVYPKEYVNLKDSGGFMVIVNKLQDYVLDPNNQNEVQNDN